MIDQASGVNQDILSRFAVMERNGRMAHAYLFIGSTGIGKRNTALAVAQLLNCEGNESGRLDAPCGVCGSCRKIEADIHPDVACLSGSLAESIKIDDVRSIVNKAQLKAFEARKKVFILSDIERLTIDAANAFLKTLEEPAKDTLLILTTSIPEQVLDTIKSRCHQIKFLPLSRRVLEERLAQDGMAPMEAAYVAYRAQGCPGRAAVLQDMNNFDLKNLFINRFVLFYDEKYVDELSKDKESVRELLDVMQSWVRDAMILKSGAGVEYLIHQDRLIDLKGFAQKYTLSDLQDLFGRLGQIQEMNKNNFNVKVSLSVIQTLFK